MKWKKYNSMTKEQKEEYNYKFEKHSIFNITGLIYIVTIYCLTMLSYTLTTYIILTNETLSAYKESVTSIFTFMIQLNQVFVVMLIFYIINSMIINIFKLYKRSKWIKDNLDKKQDEYYENE